MTASPPCRGRILLAEPDRDLASRYQQSLAAKDFVVVTAATGGDVFHHLERGSFDLLVLEVGLPPGGGMEILRGVKAAVPSMLVALITSEASVETAVEALTAGARDYLVKPIDDGKLLDMAQQAVELQGLGARRRRERELLQQEMRKNRQLQSDLRQVYVSGDGLGVSPAMREIHELVQEVANTDSTVLILGESGTGKGRVARAIHYLGSRADHPFVVANCSIYSEGVLQSELFGHEKGAFTGAIREKPGRFELAQDGTVFLDEIGELPGPIQVMLLRVLQERRFERVGGSKTLTVQARIIAATNRDLKQSIDEGEFREDLFYRLNVIPIHVPPLRERVEDISYLAQHFLSVFARKLDKPVSSISPEALERLCGYGWPGNVRELENAMERAVVVNKNDEIGCDDLPVELQSSGESGQPLTSVSLQEMERRHILRVLRAHGWNKKKSAQILGIDRSSLYNKLKKWGIEQPHMIRP